MPASGGSEGSSSRSSSSVLPALLILCCVGLGDARMPVNNAECARSSADGEVSGIPPRFHAHGRELRHEFNVPDNSTALRLGYLYPFGVSEWRVESFSMFLLALRHVNADPNILPNHTLGFVAFDTAGQATRALTGAIAMRRHVVGFVGTAFSSSVRPTAVFASSERIPMVSPGSTSPSLGDKRELQFLLRTASNEIGAMHGLLSFILDVHPLRV
jgi:ABC-type branched-subunit amino acid transport system substrate-binding protein